MGSRFKIAHPFDKLIYGGAIVLITQNFNPNKTGRIKRSFLKFSKLRDVAYRIRDPYLFHFDISF